MLVRVHRRMRNAAKVVQGASLYVFAKITEAEQAMVTKAQGARESYSARGPAGAMASIRVSECARSCGKPDFIIWKAGKTGAGSLAT